MVENNIYKINKRGIDQTKPNTSSKVDELETIKQLTKLQKNQILFYLLTTIIFLIIMIIQWNLDLRALDADLDKQQKSDFLFQKYSLIGRAIIKDLESTFGRARRRAASYFSVGIKYSFINNTNQVQNVETSGVLYKYGGKCYVVSIYDTLVSPRIIKDNKYNTTNIQLYDIETFTFMRTRAQTIQ